MFNLGGIKLVRLFLKKFLEMLLFAAAAVYSIFKYFTFTNPNTHTVTTIVVVLTLFLLICMLISLRKMFVMRGAGSKIANSNSLEMVYKVANQ